MSPKTVERLSNLAIAALVIFFLVATYGMYAFSRDCAARGGIAIHGQFHNSVCLSPDAIK